MQAKLKKGIALIYSIAVMISFQMWRSPSVYHKVSRLMPLTIACPRFDNAAPSHVSYAA